MGINNNAAKNENGTNYWQRLMQYITPTHRMQMHIKPYTQEIVDELRELMGNAYMAKSMTITEKDGTFTLTSIAEVHCQKDFVQNMRGSLYQWWRKYEWYTSEAKNLVTIKTPNAILPTRNALWSENDVGMTVAEEDRKKNFYAVIISPTFIEATRLPKFEVNHAA